MPIIISNPFQLLCALEYQHSRCLKPLQVIILGDQRLLPSYVQLLKSYGPDNKPPIYVKTLYKGSRLKRNLIKLSAIVRLITLSVAHRHEPLIVGDASAHQVFMQVAVIVARHAVVVDDGVRTLDALIERNREEPNLRPKNLFERPILKNFIFAYSFFDISVVADNSEQHSFSGIASFTRKKFKDEAHLLISSSISEYLGVEGLTFLVRKLEAWLACPVLLRSHPKQVKTVKLAGSKWLSADYFYEDLVKRLGYFPKYLITNGSSSMASIASLSHGGTILINLSTPHTDQFSRKKVDLYLAGLREKNAVLHVTVSLGTRGIISLKGKKSEVSKNRSEKNMFFS